MGVPVNIVHTDHGLYRSVGFYRSVYYIDVRGFGQNFIVTSDFIVPSSAHDICRACDRMSYDAEQLEKAGITVERW